MILLATFAAPSQKSVKVKEGSSNGMTVTVTLSVAVQPNP